MENCRQITISQSKQRYYNFPVEFMSPKDKRDGLLNGKQITISQSKPRYYNFHVERIPVSAIMKIEIRVVMMIIRTIHSITFAPLFLRLGDQDQLFQVQNKVHAHSIYLTFLITSSICLCKILSKL